MMMQTTTMRKQQLKRLIADESTKKTTTVTKNLTSTKLKCGFALGLSLMVSVPITSPYLASKFFGDKNEEGNNFDWSL